MIPKIIHYCWFGEKEKGKDVKACIETWHRKCPEYTFIEWNEKNFDINKSCRYVKEAYETGKWAFVTDYVRFYALLYYGGIYLDTDVEVLQTFDSLLDNKAFVCVESKYSICTATIGAEKNAEFVKNILKQYKNRNFKTKDGYDTTPNSQFIYNWLKNNYKYKYLNNKTQNLGICTVYPVEFFSPINCYTLECKISENTYSVHRYAGTWKSERQKRKDKIMSYVTKFIGEEYREALKQFLKEKK